MYIGYRMNFVLMFVLLLCVVKFGCTSKNNTHVFSYSVDKAMLPWNYTASILKIVSTVSKTSCAVEFLKHGCSSALFDPSLQRCHIRSVPLNPSEISTAYSTSKNVSMIYMALEEWISTTSSSTTTTTTSPTTTTTAGALDLKVGDRVTRGPDWEWGNQDGGAGSMGEVTNITAVTTGWVLVKWDVGLENEYRNGAEGKIDLAWVTSLH